MQLYPMLIDGQSVQSSDTLEVINPATGRPFAVCSKGGAAHVDNAVDAARRAFPEWSRTSSEERKKLCHRLGELLELNMPEFMELVSKESGKPMNGLNGVGSGMEVGGAIAWTHATADLELPMELIQDDEDARVEVHRKPLGVVGSITPWNWPLLIAIWHTIPALRSGNTVVVKPSEHTPIATARFAELANQVLAPGVLNIILGGADVGAALAAHPDVDKIVFTGSISTGRHIMSVASATVKRLTLELGGNDAGIVLPDVDVKAAAPKIFGACFHNNGQTCAALKRLYVHEDVHDEIVQQLVELAESTVVGDGLDVNTELGPLQNEAQLNIVKEFADDARRFGGEIVTGGAPIDGPGYFFQPTIVAGLSDGSRLVDEEPFGPILPIVKFSDVDDVIKRANNSPNGLGGSVWSSDRKNARLLAMRLECGTAWVNDHGAIQPNAPFGGVKQSGFGVEFGSEGLKEFTSIQTIKITNS